jgi:hypothetical protein
MLLPYDLQRVRDRASLVSAVLLQWPHCGLLPFLAAIISRFA